MEAWKDRKQAARDWQNEDLKPDGLALESKHRLPTMCSIQQTVRGH